VFNVDSLPGVFKVLFKYLGFLVGSVSNLPVSGSITAWRLARGCAFLSLEISL